MKRAQSEPRGILPFKDWPAVLRRHPKLVRGVCVGMCICKGEGDARGFKRGSSTAHAHCHSAKFKGWICAASAKHLDRDTALHELTHLLTDGVGAYSGHGVAFYKKLTELHGGKLPPGEVRTKKYFAAQTAWYSTTRKLDALSAKWQAAEVKRIGKTKFFNAVMYRYTGRGTEAEHAILLQRWYDFSGQKKAGPTLNFAQQAKS